ncbi:TauD/TfdA family dioxygenase [Verrucomicrobia bacterium]|nr:TauD/TfdA family dioxygenase [Verrucomicrobiota bacterium]
MSDSSQSVVRAVSVGGQQQHGDSVFPYVFLGESPEMSLEDLTSWISANREEVLRLATKHGAVLFRDCGTRSVEDFDGAVQALGLENFPYKKSLSNAVRVNRTERVFSANEAPPDVQIFFHHEMAQTPLFPGVILFYCEIASETGGATPICRSDVLFDRLKTACPEFAEACERKGLQYSNLMPGEDDAQSGMGRSWKSTLGVKTVEEAEARLRDLNYTWEWREDGSLRATTPPLPAVMELSEGRKTFFNQLIAAYCGWKDNSSDPSDSIRHGDGSKLDADAVKRAIEIANELSFDVAWQPGDFVVVDNTITMHARRSFTGTRKVVASLADMRMQSFQVANQS